MSTNQLRAATTAAKEPKSFQELIEVMKPEIGRALPKHLNADRMVRIALTEYRKNPKIGECDLRTTFGAIITLSQLGLEPGVMGQSWLVPYGKQCQGIPGWQGHVDLVSRTGRATPWTGAVYAGDFFEYELGDRPFVKHKPDESGRLQPLDALTHVYAVGRVNGAEWPVIEVWSIAKIKAHRDRFNKVGNKHYSFQHLEMYARKIPLLQVLKYMPKSVELQRAMDLEDAANRGITIDMQEAKDGGWAPTPEPEDSGNEGAGNAGGHAGTDLAGYVAQFSDDKAIEQIKGCKEKANLEAVWSLIQMDYEKSKRQIPNSVHGAYTDRKAALEQM